MIVNFFQDFSEIVAGTTTVSYGNCSNALIPRGTVPTFHRTLIDMYDMHSLTVPKMTHSDITHNIHTNDLSTPADALITNLPKHLIAVTTGDCIPVFLYDPTTKSIGIVHSGRRGLLQKITNKTILKMCEDFDIDLSSLVVQIGVHICKDCYEVGSDILEEFGIPCDTPKGYLNMQEILLDDLHSLNIKNIRTSPYCTLCSKDENQQNIFYSHRGKDPQRMLSFIGIL